MRRRNATSVVAAIPGDTRIHGSERRAQSSRARRYRGAIPQAKLGANDLNDGQTTWSWHAKNRGAIRAASVRAALVSTSRRGRLRGYARQAARREACLRAWDGTSSLSRDSLKSMTSRSIDDAAPLLMLTPDERRVPHASIALRLLSE